MSSPFTESHDGVRLRVRVIPKAGQNMIGEVRDGVLFVKVTAVPEKGQANAAVIKLLAKAWSIPASKIEVVAGATSRNKTLLLHGIELDQLPDLN